MYKFLPLATLFIILDCTKITPEPNTPPNPIPLTHSCQSACANLRALKCQGAKGSPGADDKFDTTDDVSCETTCEDVIRQDIIQMPTACVTASTTCQQANNCH